MSMVVTTFGAHDPQVATYRAFGDELYRGDPLRVQVEDRFPPTSTLWLCQKEDTTLARCVTFTRNDLPDSLFLGWYESVEDFDASRALLEAVFRSARAQGCVRIIGPVNGSTWHQYRFAEPLGETFFLDVYHKPWYSAQFRDAGFGELATYYSSTAPIEEGLRNVSVHVRDLDVSQFDKELRTIYDISCASFSDNFLYSPISFSEYAALYGRMREIIQSRLVKLALDDTGSPMGFLFALPNKLDPRGRSIILKTVAVLPAFRGKGVMMTLSSAVQEEALRLGFSDVIYALYEERNVSSRLALKGNRMRTYHLFERAV
jgi:GNAT superfamily N-acetyltransferase